MLTLLTLGRRDVGPVAAGPAWHELCLKVGPEYEAGPHGRDMEDKAVAGAGAQGEALRDPVGVTAGRWRTMVVSVVVAVVLSVTATLVLGGAFRSVTAGAGAFVPCGAGGGCCPPGSEGAQPR